MPGVQEPFPVVVNINFTNPAASSAAVGEYDAASVVLLGLNTPPPPDQIPVFVPVTEPLKIVIGFCLQIVLSAPALAEMATEKEVTVTVA